MFREDKTTQAAARFLTLADGRLPYTLLMKLLYSADAEMLVKRGTLITFDQWYISPLGPVLDATLNLIRSENAPSSFWSRFIGTQGLDVVLQADPGNDDLSKAEDAIIERTFSELWGKGNCDVRESHPGFPELNSLVPVSYEQILEEYGFSCEDVNDIVGHIKDAVWLHQFANSTFSRSY